MARWFSTVKLTHLFTKQEDYESIKKSMAEIAKVIESETCFSGFDTKRFYKIPKGDDVIGAVDYANRLINRMYNFADDRRIWIE
jgi:hypothetical protein